VRIGAGSFTFDQASAGRAVAIDPVGDVTGNVLTGGTSVLIRSSGKVDIGNLRAGDLADLSADVGLRVGSLNAASLNASTGGALTMDVLLASGKLQVGARAITMNVASGGPRLDFDLTGYRGGVADSVSLVLDAPLGATFPRLRAANAEVKTNGDSNRIVAGYITQTLRFTNPSGQFYMNNVHPASIAGPILQLVQPGFGFTLAQDAVYYATDAYVTQYAAQYRPIAPNHQENRETNSILVFGASAVRAADGTDGRLHDGPGAPGVPAFVRPALQASPTLKSDGDGAPVNWGDEAPLAGPGVIELATSTST
jgi:hypothetical protein